MVRSSISQNRIKFVERYGTTKPSGSVSFQNLSTHVLSVMHANHRCFFSVPAVEEARTRLLESCVDLLEVVKTGHSAAVPALLQTIKTEVRDGDTGDAERSVFSHYVYLLFSL